VKWTGILCLVGKSIILECTLCSLSGYLVPTSLLRFKFEKYQRTGILARFQSLKEEIWICRYYTEYNSAVVEANCQWREKSPLFWDVILCQWASSCWWTMITSKFQKLFAHWHSVTSHKTRIFSRMAVRIIYCSCKELHNFDIYIPFALYIINHMPYRNVYLITVIDLN
jgi:hypothetical protein